MTPLPDRVPAAELSVGSHLGPDVGMCLMEAVSRFAGLPWSDGPACTHPLVAHLARLVNDASSDEGRQPLAAFVPRLAAAAGDDAAYARVAKACAEAAWDWRRSLLLAHLVRLAEGQVRRDVTGREAGWSASALLASRLYRRGPAFRTVEVSVAATRVLQGRERDRALADLLGGALAGVAVAAPGQLPPQWADSAAGGNPARVRQAVAVRCAGTPRSLSAAARSTSTGTKSRIGCPSNSW